MKVGLIDINVIMKQAQKYFFVVLAALVCSTGAYARKQASSPEDSSYTKVITERSAKILKALQLSDSVKAGRLLQIVVGQYRNLNTIHESSKAVMAGIKQSGVAKEELDAAVKKEEEKKNALLKQQHDVFIAHLKKELPDQDIEKIKDGMTYGVLPITYKAYQDMLPSLTDAQKQQIYTWLLEAREYAMDAESSEKKHAWFGKYKGRINNYLSAAGIDMKKAGEDWQKRLKEKQEVKKELN
jgi:hypothetical protein